MSSTTSTSTSQKNMIDATHPLCETGDLPSRYAPLVDTIRRLNGNYKMLIDTAKAISDISGIAPDEIRSLISKIVANFGVSELLKIMNVLPYEGDVNSDTIKEMCEERCTETIISRAIYPTQVNPRDASYLAKADKRGRDVDKIKKEARLFKIVVNENFPNSEFRGESQIFPALLQVLIEEINDEPSARKDALIIFTNQYNCEDEEFLSLLCDAIRDRPHCEIHFIAGDLDSVGNNNPNDDDNQTTVHYLKNAFPESVFLHCIEDDESSETKIAEKFNSNNAEVSMEVLRRHCPVRIGEDMVYGLRITNQMATEIPVGTRIYLESNSYFLRSEYIHLEEPIAIDGDVIVPILVTPRVNKGIDDLPKYMNILVEVPRDRSDEFKLLKKVTFEVNIEDYCLNFFSPTSGIPIKTQVFGIKGAGKSLLIASFFSMLYDSENFHLPVEQGLLSRASPNDVTRQIVEIIPQNKYIQKVLGKDTQIGVNFKDAPGIDIQADSFDGNPLEHKRYNDFHIKSLVHGALPTGIRLQAGDDQNSEFTNVIKDKDKDYFEKLDQYMIEQRPHSILFCVNPSALNDQKCTERISLMLEKFTQEGIPLIVCLTQMDKVDENLDENPLFKSQSVNNIVQTASTSLGVNIDNIIYSVSYGRTKEGKKVFEYDKLIFKNLEKIQRISEQYAMRLRKEGNQLTGNALDVHNRFQRQRQDM